jgi:uncharacterized protein DUF1801
MFQGEASSPEELLAGLPPERREALSKVREIILANLPPGYVESMQSGMIGYGIPLERYPNTYNGQPLGYAALANQKNHMSLYLMSVYGSPDEERWFKQRYAQSAKKLDMGKACLRFKRLEDLPLDLIGEAIARTPVERYIAGYEAARHAASERRKA